VWGCGRKTRGRGRIHSGERGRFRGTVPTSRAHRIERVGERTGNRADERGSRDSERRCVCEEEIGADKSAPPDTERERGERAGAGWRDKRGPPIRGRRACARGLRWDGLGWLGLK
jgi:hypothetical protein